MEQTDLGTADRRPPPSSGRRPLVRPLERRAIAGVATGLGDLWDVNPNVVRLGFVLTTVFGGFGLVVYLAMWLLIPNDRASESIAESALRRARSGESWVGVALIAVAIVIVVSSLDFISGPMAWAAALLVVGYFLYRERPLREPGPADGDQPDSGAAPEAPPTPNTSRGGNGQRSSPRLSPPDVPPAPRAPRPPRLARPPSILGRLAVATALVVTGLLGLADVSGADLTVRHYVGALLVVVALGLLVGTWFGRARWLIVPGLLLVPVAAVSTAADLPLDVDIDRIEVVVDQEADLVGRYEFGAGDVVVDLRNVVVTEPTEVAIEMDVGQLLVVLPPDTAGRVDAQVGIGALGGTLGTTGGLGVDEAARLEGRRGPLDVDVRLGIGDLTIERGGLD